MEFKLISAYKTHKAKESETDCQDAFASKDNLFAIADGATSSFYSQIWSELLVNHFCENPIFDEDVTEWLIPIQNKWLDEVKQKTQSQKDEQTSTWVTNQRRLNSRESSISTFIGLSIKEKKEKVSVNGIIVGDSCLFVKNTSGFVSQPLKNSIDFDNNPEYLASYAKDNNYMPKKFYHSLDINEKSYLILATDALAEWIIENKEHNKDVTDVLVTIKNKQEFIQFVEDARTDELKLKNDDVTLLVIEIGCITGKTLDDPVSQNMPTIEQVGSNGTKENHEDLSSKKSNLSLLQKKLKNRNVILMCSVLLNLIFLFTFVFFLNEKSPSIDKIEVTDTTIKEISDDTQKPVIDSTTLEVNEKTNLKLTEKPLDSLIIHESSKIYNSYNNNEFVIFDSTQNSFEVKIDTVINEKTYFKHNMFVYKTVAQNIRDDEIQIQSGNNIRLSKDTIAGNLKTTTNFLVVKNYNLMYEIIVTGYIKKHDNVSN